MRVLAGMYAPEAGRMEVNGRDVTGWSTADAIAAGVGMVHQHFMLVPTLTVAENIDARPRAHARRCSSIVAARRARGGGAERARRASPCARERIVADLSVGEAQRVEILKTLYRGARMLILDEPTAVLSPPEIDELWSVLRAMRARGETIVLITHKLDEVMEISDTITVMRHGETVEPLRHGEHDARRDRAARWSAATCSSRWTSSSESSAALRTGVVERSRLCRRRRSLDVRDLVVEDARRLTAVNGVSFAVAAGRDPRHRRRRRQRTDGTDRGDRRSPRRALRCDLGSAARDVTRASREGSAATPVSRTFPKTATRAGSSSTTRSPRT